MSRWCSPSTWRSISCMPGSTQGYAMLKARQDAGVSRPEARRRIGRWHTWTAALTTCARKQPLGALGGVILLTMIIVVLLASSLAPFDPYAVHVLYKYASPGTLVEEPGQRFWLGAD